MKNIAALVSLVFLSACAIAQKPTEKTLLWEVSGKGIKSPSFVFGTIHLMCPQDLKMPETVKQKFNATDHLFLEIDMDDPAMMPEMMAGMMMKDSSTIKGLLGEEKYDRLNKIFQSKTGFPLELMQKTKPMLLMALVYPSLLACQPESWEKAFQDLAAERKINLSGLEKVSDQINVFEKIPYKVQADMLMSMLDNLDSSKSQFESMLEIYKAKDINKMHEMTVQDKDFGEYEALLLNDRNKNWIPVIANHAQKMPTFFAVGAGHLGGDKGVISLLRADGFTVKPVFYK